MKNLVFASIILLVITSCSKNAVSPGQSYHGSGGAYINFSNIKWYVTQESGSTILNLDISGNTNADKLTMTTSGDGLASEIPITLNSGKFTESVGVSFTHAVVTSMQGSTQITIYRGSDKLVVPLTSGTINN
jgi:hypothetical protein